MNMTVSFSMGGGQAPGAPVSYKATHAGSAGVMYTTQQPHAGPASQSVSISLRDWALSLELFGL